ncbi:MAG: response regulator [Candidatus Shapirobacteria bacterium]|jgi:CheY-like chemotaxis protein
MTNSQKRILVVEDDVALRDLYVQILTDSSFQVESVADGQEAFEAMKKGGYDLVLLDIILPKVDGLTILEKLSTEAPPEKPNFHVVVLSNLGQDEAISKAMSLGAEGYLIKSDYTPGQVVEQVNHFLEMGDSH